MRQPRVGPPKTGSRLPALRSGQRPDHPGVALCCVTGRQGSDLQWWERTLLVLFGLWLSATEFGPSWLDAALGVAGLAIVMAAVGAVEVVMALYYRTQHRRRAGRQS